MKTPVKMAGIEVMHLQVRITWNHRKLEETRKAPLWEPIEGGQCAET